MIRTFKDMIFFLEIMPLRFKKHAIELSGSLGTKLKSEILGKYYQFWWQITSGGNRANYNYNTTIIELNAGTGEVYISDTKEYLLGSAGHAIELKYSNPHIEKPNLNLILVEENKDCLMHLKKNIKEKYPNTKIIKSEEDFRKSDSSILIITKELKDVIEKFNKMNIKGNSLYFFDPLLHVEYQFIKKTYYQRINSFLETGIEFIIFVFTSDWVYGRKGMIESIPFQKNMDDWTDEEWDTVDLLDLTLDGNKWQKDILNLSDKQKCIDKIIFYYRKKLHELFRFVIPLPFSPKPNQIYHLIFCSNYQTGASLISRFYENSTNNKQSSNNKERYSSFKRKYGNILNFPSGRRRPSEWKILWHIYKHYRYGLFDIFCQDLLKKVNKSKKELQDVINWLKSQDFIKEIANNTNICRYRVNFQILNKKLKFNLPQKYKPLKDSNFMKH